MYTFTSLEGNSQKLDGGAMFGNAPRTMWEKWIKPDELGRIPLSCRCFLIEFEGHKILLEAGIGSFFEPKFAERFGVQTPDRHILLEELSSINVKPEGITHVILSHLHFDHAGGILPSFSEIENGNENLVFTNAEYWVGREALNRALKPHPRDKASFIPGLCDKLKATGNLKIIEEQALDKVFGGRLSFFESEGHTPGQNLAIFKGDKQQIIFCGDLVPGEHWVHLPVSMGYDRFPERVIEEKKELYESLDLEKTFLCFTHDNKTAAGFIEKTERGRYQVRERIEKAARREF